MPCGVIWQGGCLITLKNSSDLTRRHWLAASGAALLPGLPGCGWLLNQPIAIAAHTWLGYEPLFLAQREGWLDPQLAQVVQTTNATESLEALVQGKVQGVALTMDEMLRARASGQTLTAVLVFNVSAGADMLVSRPGIKTLADLKGKRVGYESGSVGDLLLSEILELAKLTKKDVSVMPLTVDTHLHAWEGRLVDALISYEPVGSQLVQRGGVKLFDSRQTPNMIVDVLAMRTDVLDRAHDKAMRHLTAGHFQALERLHHNPQDTAYRMAEHLGLPASGVLAAFKGLLLPDVPNNHRLLAGTAPDLMTSAKKLSTTMVKAGFLGRDDTLAALVNGKYVPLQESTK